ncbi:MAG: 30S ribosome-binding factor RbfA [Verrucomicrobia bacterium]|nr:30S ribosome-binding factor RbfA [Verrucomicrobiota bacterium]
MQSLRIQRVRELLKREIGEIIRREISLEKAGLITVNDVGVSNDLHSATVFVSIVGKPEQQKAGAKILRKEQKRLQSLVGRSVVLKYTPHLRFVVGDSIAQGNHILELIDEIEKTLPAPVQDDEPS